ncbi:GTPase Era [Marivirga tractuosa]|uniref:GTPase Era n=1 Tax=Marivirga tractuosa (strain ATCC 23168 / DSM 4126 / NBRC 15989 / NCIMB 1408 / VKM B-1430 / H-43) TaxID=643867 RepID=E4TQY7_MARTH|nr:GTPase Era [Marivirga tractuosa]ADR21687.1 GTP-binding protein Era [Marivirga tractuosa DSM 4126]BDD13856.1 GTPase Era [Marivirga tractuosa]
MSENQHKAGFVSIVGKPNVGKSTLMNALVGERLSIITSKAQTTRHRIMGILSGADFQIVYSDTPGILSPQYELHNSMMRFVKAALEDADIMLFVTDLYEKYEEGDVLIDRIKNSGVPIILIMNKIDQSKGSQAQDKMKYWAEIIEPDHQIMVSALEKVNIDGLFNKLMDLLPVHPPYFPKEEMTDKPEKFFVEEIIREKIFQNYKKEVPYSCEVVVTEFKEDETIIRIRAEIYVERKSQKGIIIGKGGEAIKKVGIESRKDLETFFNKQIHLETFVKVEQDWRKKDLKLKRFGY